jgi:hypothetical protein
MNVDEIAVVSTPAGGWTGEMPSPVLAGCTTPLANNAPDMRGMWRVAEVVADVALQPDHPTLGHVQRIEQADNRVIITAGGIIHDMRCDGSETNGVNDVAEFDKQTRITVVATFEDGVHVLRPVGMPIEVRRRIEDGRLIWDYLGFTATLDRVG